VKPRGQKIRVSQFCCSALQDVAEAPEEGIAKIFTLKNLLIENASRGVASVHAKTGYGKLHEPTKQVR
jgi:hypothetical protein